ncbi:Ubiquitin-conjugating enzyme E2 15 [Podospora bellae-mahoneyi]|uniref:Ubiquitin-conjugating enzyme E2 2 n=3 Tax=Podospora TaxID=5144 RepID=A0ABR0FDD2_9PEZI|nr:Ubiquitin-conjugating enzyme E2 15 [Podospora bellae-mahoneyi]
MNHFGYLLLNMKANSLEAPNSVMVVGTETGTGTPCRRFHSGGGEPPAFDPAAARSRWTHVIVLTPFKSTNARSPTIARQHQSYQTSVESNTPNLVREFDPVIQTNTSQYHPAKTSQLAGFKHTTPYHNHHIINTMSSVSSAAAASLLKRQLKQMQTDKDIPGISCGLVSDNNIFEWEVMLMISDECKYYGGGNFRAILTFPPTYPLMPPKLVFQSPIPFHPNIYPDGRLCISILHPPEEDISGYEKASERWSPVQSPESILLSVISLFEDPNDESPANLDAAVLLREEREGKSREFRKRVRQCVRESLGED